VAGNCHSYRDLFSVAAVVRHLRGNLPWLDCAERYDRAHTFRYMDPPYWQTAGSGVDFPFENYERMADFMRRCKGTVMVSINDHPDILRAFEGFHFDTVDIQYCNTHQLQGTVGVSGELVIMTKC
jgi:DNA adenine methylase